MCIRDRNEDKTAIFENWCDFLNYFDSSIFVQLSFINQKASPVSYTHLDVYKRQDIVMAVFDIGQNVVSGAAGVIHGNTSIDIDSTIAQMRTGMENMGVGELLGLSIETLLISQMCIRDRLWRSAIRHKPFHGWMRTRR